MLLHVFGVIVLISACTATDLCTCDGTDLTNSDNCEHLFRLFENSLLTNGGNLFKIRNIFNPPSAGFPKLVNITYHLHFTTNRSTISSIPTCPCPAAVNDSAVLNTTTTTTLRYGGTTAGIYTFVRPALLHQAQLQLPLLIMRQYNSDHVPFLWDGLGQLPSVTINLTVPSESFKCLPANSEVAGVVRKITSLLKYYVRSEQRVGARLREIDEHYYALDGSFVQELTPCDPSLNTSIVIHYFSQAIHDAFYGGWGHGVVIYFILMVILIAFKYSNRKKILDPNTRPTPFVIAFIIVITVYGTAVIIADIYSYFAWMRCSLAEPVWLKLGILLSMILITIGAIIVEAIMLCCFRNHFARDMICIKLLIWLSQMIIPFLILLMFWIAGTSFSVLFLAFAYPINTITLVFLHLALVFLVTVTLTIWIARVKLEIRKVQIQLCSNLCYRCLLRCCLQVLYVLSGILVLLVVVVMFYWIYMIGFALTLAEGFITTESNEAIVAFFPAVGLFVFAILLKNTVFIDKGKVSIAVQMIVDVLNNDELPLLITDRMRLGRRLGVPTRKLEQFELEASLRSPYNSRRVALTKIITYWLNDLPNPPENHANLLRNLAEAYDEVIGQPFGDRIRMLNPDIAID